MNKFKFISREPKELTIKKNSLKELDHFTLRINNRTTFIEDKRENVRKEVNAYLSAVKADYIKMNNTTLRKLKFYYGYDVDYVPKNLNDKIGKISGQIGKIKIILDNSLDDFVIAPFIYITSCGVSKSKFDFIKNT